MIIFRSFIFICLLIPMAYANFEVTSVQVVCVAQTCSEAQRDFSSLKRTFLDLKHFNQILKLYVVNNGLSSMSYKLIGDSSKKLELYIKRKKEISSVSIKFVSKEKIDFPLILPIKKGDFFSKSKVSETKKLLNDIAKNNGYNRSKVFSEILNLENNEVEVQLDINLGQAVKLNDVFINSNSTFLKKMVEKKMFQYINGPFNLQLLKNEMEDIRQLFLNYGYYLSTISLRHRFLSQDKVSLHVDIKKVSQYAFSFKGNTFFSSESLKELLSETLIGYKREMSIDNIVTSLKELYSKRGFLSPSFKVSRSRFKNPHKDNVNLYQIDIDEKKRYILDDVELKGNNYIASNEIQQMFEREMSGQASSGFYDYIYYENFSEKLKELYISKGFVSVYIDKPKVQFVLDSNKFTLSFRIKEGSRAEVSRIDFGGIDASLEFEIRKILHSRLGNEFNPIQFKLDIKKIEEYLYEEGYYFASILDGSRSKAVKYIKDNSQVEIKLDIKLGRKLYLNEIIIIGNKKTRKKLIKKNLDLRSGILLTRSGIQAAELKLLGLGLFSSVKITPVISSGKLTDLLVFIKEKDFGSIEIAPGVRTDLGMKLSSVISYNNIDGLNKRLSFKGSMNNRFNLKSLDETRRKNSNSLLEYYSEINYSESYLFNSNVSYSATVSKSRIRFFAFDADIQKVKNTLTTEFTSWLSLGVTHQLETISQFDATIDTEHGHFQIGAITPSLTFDFRDNRINPTKGLYSLLSCEFANNAFGSQNNDELKIDYYKLISRNRLYYPMGEKGVLAVSTTFGIQENNAKGVDSTGSNNGYIPGIKVFRLSGVDAVRGFEDDEINWLSSGEDISEITVNNKAYMANIKLEPRFYLSDSTMLGVFYDAGRVFVDKFSETDLRSSVGLSFKYLTPVGSLDFDYGIKLLRKRYSGGKLESPGRLHVSIGFF